MKKLLLILLCLPLLFSCGGNKKENWLTKVNLKGKVKELTETTFNAKEAFGDLAKDGLEYKCKYKIDEDGNLIEFNQYDNDGELIEKWKAKYDEDGNLIEESHYDKDGELVLKQKCKYDEDGNLTEWTSFGYFEKDEELDFMYKYKYAEFDKKNNWIVKVRYSNDTPTAIEEREIEYY